MIDVLKLFYTTHYNLGAVAILLLMLLIFFLSKKNFKGAIIVGVLLIVYNVGIYKRTEGKSWTIEIDPPAATPNEYGSYSEAQPIKMTFTATHPSLVLGRRNVGQVRKHRPCRQDLG